MRFGLASIGPFAVFLGIAPMVIAHHSFTRYYLQTEVTLNGTVSRLEWANPHVYLYVETQSEDGELVTWQIEGQPPSVLRRFGWTPEALRAGDSVVVTGRPSRNEDDNEALGVSVLKNDGSSLVMNFNVPALQDRGTPSAVTASDLSGTWLTVLPENAGSLAQFITGPRTWPLTDKGAQAVEEFDQETMLPGIECTPYQAPFLMILPDVKVIDIGDEVVSIRTEFEGVERTVRMDVESHDGATTRSQGHSIGRWEGNVLVVDATHFADHRSGNALSLPSGPSKHLVERFELNPDRTSLTYSFELEDPEYMASPVVSGELLWVYRPDLEYAPAECDIENARRFVD